MPVIVDGNNLLHVARQAEQDGPMLGRSLLCHKLGQWAQRRQERIHVVFDGPAPNENLAAQISGPIIQVTYSGSSAADAVLKNILEADSAARRLLVVSSDREIARAARRRRARSIRSEEFWALVQLDLARPPPKRPEPREKWAGLEPAATDQWIREFGLEGSNDRSEENHYGPSGMCR